MILNQTDLNLRRKMDKFCQSCGMPLVKKEDFGTNADGLVNEEYCIYCFQNGAFTKDCTMEEMVESNLNFLEEFNKDTAKKFTKEEARREMLNFFPMLKRWKKGN